MDEIVEEIKKLPIDTQKEIIKGLCRVFELQLIRESFEREPFKIHPTI